MSGLFDQITNYSPPLLTAGQVNYKGTWSAAANSPTLTSPPPATSKGDYYVVSAAGTQFGITFAVGDWIISNGTAWEKVDLTDAVSSVFGRTGAVVSANGDYTASQVTNVPAGTISSTNVQDAINELSADIATAQNVLDAYVTNAESVTITKGQVVYAFGATGNRMSVKLANNSADATSAKTVGVVLDSSIAAGNPGYIRMVGVVDGLNLGAYNDGDTLYLGATAGSVTSTKPYAPNHLVYVGIVERANNGNGQLYVRVQNGYELDEIHDVQITSAPASGALLVRDATNSLWKAARLTAGTNIAITNADASVTVGITGVIAGTNGGTGVNNGANTITIAGNVTHAGAFTQTFTATANTSLTLPVTGTLATLAGSEALSNKTITASPISGSTGAFTTLTASGDTTLGQNLTLQGGAIGALIKLNANAGVTQQVQFQQAGTNKWQLYYETANGNLSLYDSTNSTNRWSASSTGLAVTGTLSATGTISTSAGNITALNGILQVGSGSKQLYLRTLSGVNRIDSYDNPITATQPLLINASTMAFQIADSTKMTLDASGNVGIGTSSPSAKLEVSGASAAGLSIGGRFTNTTASGFTTVEFSNGSATMGQIWAGNGSYASFGGASSLNYSANSGPHVWYTNYVERARIDSGGNLLVGTTSRIGGVDAPIHAYANGGSTILAQQVSITADNLSLWNSASSGNQVFAGFYTDNPSSLRGSITYNRGTGLVVYGTTSDYRAKDILGPVVDSGALIDAVPVYMGKMKGATLERPMFIAHETPAYAHTGEKNAVDAEGKPIYQQIDTSTLVPVLWAEIQSLRQRVAALESN